MASCAVLLTRLEAGHYDQDLAALSLDRDRALAVCRRLLSDFSPAGDAALFSAPGRTELGGNHTDHQGGRVLCAAVDVDMAACAAPNGLPVIRMVSDGFPRTEVDLRDLTPKPEEEGTPAALIRGMAAEAAALGFAPDGLDMALTSAVPPGSGLSSSAAFEVLLGAILNHFFCGGRLDPLTIAKMGQRTEHRHFGKPCGLMDQTACAVGGAVAIDFGNESAPAVTPIPFDLARFGHVLCMVDTGSCHADLTADYAAIPHEMGAVAAALGKTRLRDLEEASFRAAIPALRSQVGDRAVLRALHFFAEDRRAALEAEALSRGDFAAFLALVNESGRSSALLLQNSFSPADPRQQAIPLALEWGREALGGTGAIRVHGGGFAGTVQAFVPAERLDTFRAAMEALFGTGCCRALAIRNKGGCLVAQ